MSWLDACAYAELERANGMRFPPTIAALRVAASRCQPWGPPGSGGVAGTQSTRYRRSHESRGGETLVAGSGPTATGQLRDPGNVTQPRDRRDSRWDEHRRARREQLVQATLAAVGRHGAGVGMDEIAAEAGTSKTVVYRHFADRTRAATSPSAAEVAGQLLAELRDGDARAATTRAR